LVAHDPAALVRLPATCEKARDRVATPGEFVRLLDALALQTPKEKADDVVRDLERALSESVPWALAGYGTARNQEIRHLDWQEVDWSLAAVELAADEEGRKPGGSWRVVPMVKPLRQTLRRAWHKTPAYQEGAAPIMLSRYTHTLPGELERTRDLLDKFLVERSEDERGAI
jgi:hypothetical protein